jgi:hypothetical protein
MISLINYDLTYYIFVFFKKYNICFKKVVFTIEFLYIHKNIVINYEIC